jgi:type II secretory pathway component PulF
MPTYRYRAKKGPQEIIESKIQAQSETEAIEKINQIGLIPIRIEEEHPTASAKTSYWSKPKGKVPSREITIFSRELASLLKSGVPILAALNIISEQSESIHLKNTLRIIHDAVKDGSTFSAVLSMHPNIFSPLYVAMIRSGEDSGALAEVLLRIAGYRAKQEEMISRFRMALAYPVLMAIVGLGTVIFMLTFVMPRLMKVFINLGQDLPLPTKILIFTSNGLRQWGFWIILILALIILILRRQMRTKAGRIPLSLLKLHLPLYGKFTLKAELARFSRTLELLIKNGIPILQAINIAIPVLENEIIKNQLKQSYKELEQGGSLGRSLRNSRLFPLFMTNLIIVGEESGNLDEALSEIAGSYERDTDESMRIMASLLEPLMILAMGLIVGFIVVAMLLPIFQINVMAR